MPYNGKRYPGAPGVSGLEGGGNWIGDGRAIHLSKAVGKPAIWTLAEFAAHERYQVLIGAKRMRR